MTIRLYRFRWIGREDDVVATRVNFVQQTEDDIEALAQFGSVPRSGLDHAKIEEPIALRL
jgi:hypothetical protein